MSPVFSGYRPQMRFALQDRECRRIEFLSRNSVAPGEEADALIQLSENASSELERRLRNGFLFELAEGARVVGTGKITEIDI